MLTIVGTGVAAVYIYYQMRIYLVKKERYNRAQELEQNTGEGDPEMAMVDNPAQSGIGGRRSLDGQEMTSYAPYTDEPCPASAYKRVQETKATRRPFLHSNSSFGVLTGASTPSRSKSLHERDAGAISEYLKTKRMDFASTGSATGYDTPQFVISSADEASADPKEASYKAGGDEVGSHLNPFQTGTQTGRPRSDTNASTASERLLQRYNEIVEAADVVRGTASLDLWRPADMSLHARSRSPPVSGRAIAKDADQLAVLRGASRPDLGRSRGESSAALLGRPELDD